MVSVMYLLKNLCTDIFLDMSFKVIVEKAGKSDVPNVDKKK